MNSQEYWKKRALLAKQKEMASNAEYEVAMRSRLKDLENEFIRESKKWVTKYAKENNQSLKQAADYLNSIDTSKFDMTLAEFEAKARAGGFEKELNSAYYKTRIARLQELYRQYQELAARYADNEEDNMAIGLAKRYEGTYLLENYNKYLVVGGLDVNFTHFNEQELKDIVYQPWKGSNFSKRIWNNYTKVMPEVLTDTMFRSTALGYSYNRIERMLRDKFQGVVKSNIHRLVVTEMGHAAEEATAKFYKDSDIKQYQYLATLETHTCEACAHLDERIFDVKDKREGINYPLLHPYCRCTTVPYMEGLPDIPTRWYRDPITGKGKWTRNMTYSEWAKVTGAKSFSKKKLVEAKPQTKGLQAPKSQIKITSLKEFTQAIKDLGIKNVKSMNGLDSETLNSIYNTVVNEFTLHPELKGMLNTVKGGNRKKSDDVAYVRTRAHLVSGNNADNALFEFSAELNINKAQVLDAEAANDLVNRLCKAHVWSYKKDYTGVIKHEMAHAIDNRAVYTISTGNKDIKYLTYEQAKLVMKNIKNDSFANDILLDAFDACNIEPTRGNVKKYISKYAGKNIKEAFAELYSDESNSKLSQKFNQLLNKRLKEIYNQ